jgi:excisionase family DNA binding protein
VPGNLISIREVCDRFGLSDKTIRRKIKDGTLVAYRCGERLIKLDADQVEGVLLRPVGGRSDETIQSAVATVVAAAPPLTAEQRDRIAAILRGGSSGGDAA